MLQLFSSRKYRDAIRKAGAPIIIGATGGSGTRLVQHILDEAGIYLGDDVNESRDVWFLEDFLNQNINAILRHTGTLDYQVADLPMLLRNKLLNELSKLIVEHLKGRKDQTSWGWKHPRSYFILPLLHEIMPNMRFVHVLRDGRDMAFSNNQNQPKKHYQALFDEAFEMRPNQSIRLWSQCNDDVANWGRRTLGNRYHRIRLEDLCTQPNPFTRDLLAFTGCDNSDLSRFTTLIKTPDTLGRWKQQEWALVEELESVARMTLSRFGYHQEAAEIDTSCGMGEQAPLLTPAQLESLDQVETGQSGELCRDFLKKQGLQSHHHVLDIGSGSLQLAAHIVGDLKSAHYHAAALDSNWQTTAREKTLSDRQRDRLPTTNLYPLSQFDFAPLGEQKMDIAIAPALFSHLPINHMRHCLQQLHPHMQPGSAFYAAFFHCPDHHPIAKKLVHPVAESISDEVASHPAQSPYHYTMEDMEYVAKDTPWRFQLIGDWGHPHNLKMAAFILEG